MRRDLASLRFHALAPAAVIVMAGLLSPPEGLARTAAYRDIDGVWRQRDSASWPGVPDAMRLTLRTRSITFTVTYLDVTQDTKVGFDDPSLGAGRRSALRTVLEYLGDLLDEPGACDIEFTASQTDGSGDLVAAETFFAPDEPGFQSGAAYAHITTGIDPLPGNTPDIRATVDFGRPWHSGAGPPPPNRFDLQTVLLHHMTHALGFMTLSDAEGHSLISGGTPGVFTKFDDLLFTGAGRDLFTNAGGASFNGVPSDLAGNDGGVVFAGRFATEAHGDSRPPIFAPSPFQAGLSLSHWRSASFGSPSPAMGEVTRTGVQKRSLDFFELEALEDLGYALRGDVHVEVPVQSEAAVTGLVVTLFLVHRRSTRQPRRLPRRSLTEATRRRLFQLRLALGQGCKLTGSRLA